MIAVAFHRLYTNLHIEQFCTQNRFTFVCVLYRYFERYDDFHYLYLGRDVRNHSIPFSFNSK